MGDFNSYKRLIDSTTGGAGKNIPDNFLSSEAPKLSFNWTIYFTNRDQVSTAPATASMDSNVFAVKNMERPKPQIQYEDVNIYSFRTKVAVRTDYGSCSVSFYDDVSGNAHTILNNYMTIVSPISNIGVAGADTIDTADNNSSIGPLNNRLGPLKAITLTHYYFEEGGQSYTQYDYLNPKFTSIDFGSVDMTTSEASTVTITFNFDSVNITNSDGG